MQSSKPIERRISTFSATSYHSSFLMAMYLQMGFAMKSNLLRLTKSAFTSTATVDLFQKGGRFTMHSGNTRLRL